MNLRLLQNRKFKKNFKASTRLPVEKLQIPSVYVAWEMGSSTGRVDLENPKVIIRFKKYVSI